MARFSVGTDEYESGRLSDDKQTLVIKRLLPTFGELAACLPHFQAGVVTDLPQAASVLGRVLIAISKIEDDDLNFVINACFEVTNRKVDGGGRWVPVLQNGVIQNQNDSKFMTRLQIVWNVISESCATVLAQMGIILPAFKLSA